MQVVFNVNLDEQYVYKESYIKELAQFDEQTLATALAYARNLKLYGIDVTEKWDTVVEQSEALKNVYNKGYYDAMTHKKERIVPWVEDYTQWDPYHHSFNGFRCTKCGNIQRWQTKYCPECGQKKLIIESDAEK